MNFKEYYLYWLIKQAITAPQDQMEKITEIFHWNFPRFAHTMLQMLFAVRGKIELFYLQEYWTVLLTSAPILSNVSPVPLAPAL